MKKLVLFAAVAVAISLSACKKAAPEAPVAPEENVPVVVEDATVEGVVETTEVPAEAPAEVPAE
jgi:uncharacterized lipoprotein YbaY